MAKCRLWTGTPGMTWKYRVSCEGLERYWRMWKRSDQGPKTLNGILACNRRPWCRILTARTRGNVPRGSGVQQGPWPTGDLRPVSSEVDGTVEGRLDSPGQVWGWSVSSTRNDYVIGRQCSRSMNYSFWHLLFRFIHVSVLSHQYIFSDISLWWFSIEQDRVLISCEDSYDRPE